MGEEALAVLGPGDVFGEMCLFEEAPRRPTRRVHSRWTVLVDEPGSFFRSPVSANGSGHDILWNAVRILSKRLRETSDKLTFLLVSSKFT